MKKLLFLCTFLFPVSALANGPTGPTGPTIQVDGARIPSNLPGTGQQTNGINLSGFTYGPYGPGNILTLTGAPSPLGQNNTWTGLNTFTNYSYFTNLTFFSNYLGIDPTFAGVVSSTSYGVNDNPTFTGDANAGTNNAKVYGMAVQTTCDLRATGGTDNAQCGGLYLNLNFNSQIQNNENYLINATVNNSTSVLTLDQFSTLQLQGGTSSVGLRIAENSTGNYVFVGGEGTGSFSGLVEAASIKSPHVYPGNVQLIDLTSGSITVDLSLSNYYVIGLAGNGTIAVTHCDPGTYFTLSITQESGGSHTLAWPLATQWLNASYRGNGAGTAVTLSTTVGKRDLIYFVCDENSRPNEISENLGR